MTRHNSALLPILLILLAAFALRMWHVDTESIWHDEGWSIRAFRGPFTTPDDNTPFIYYFAGHTLWQAGGGESPLALRYVSVLLGTLTAAFAIRIGWRWFGFAAGLTVGVLVVSSPLLWEYSQEVRAYVAVPLVALAMLAGARSITRHNRTPHRAWIFIFAVELIGLYTHNLTVPLIVWLNVALGVVWLLRQDWRRTLTWAALQITLIVCYIPWLLTQSPSGTPLNTPPQPGLNLARDIWYSYFLPALPQLQDTLAGQHHLLQTSVNLFGIVGVLLVVSAAWFVFLPFNDPTVGAQGAAPLRLNRMIVQWWLLLSHAIFVPIFTTLLMLAAHIDFHPRYYIAALPGTLLLVVGSISTRFHAGTHRRVPGLHNIARRGMARHAPTTKRLYMIYAIIALAGVGTAAQSLYHITTTRAYQHDDFRGLAAYYAVLPPEAVIIIPFDAERALQDYFVDVLNIQAQIVNIPLYSDEQTVLDTLNSLARDTGRHVEFLTWFQLPADARGMYPCLLTAMHTGETFYETHFYFGLSTQRFDIAPITLQPLALDPSYREISLQDAAYAASRSGACLRTTWALNQPAPDDLNVAAALQNPIGGQLARSDAEIANAENVGTSRWQVDESGSAYNLLLPPAGVPLDAYDLSLNVYSASQPAGFDLLDESGNPAGKSYAASSTMTISGPPVLPDEAPTVPVLISDNAGAEHIIQTGISLDVALFLPQDDGIVMLEGADWSIEQPADTGQPDALSWHTFIVPPGSSGEAVLRVDSTEIARYTVVDVPRVFDPPAVDSAVGAVFPGVGMLVGVNLPEMPLSAQNPPEITLIWQAEATTEVPYTVFVQLLSPGGAVIAQSDSQPASGARPTTGWITGEYINDTHTLRFNVENYQGMVTLIAGLYNPQNFQRLLTAAGSDYARIAADITMR